MLKEIAENNLFLLRETKIIFEVDFMKTKRIVFLTTLVLIGFSFLQINSLETTNYNLNYTSGWIQTNGNKYLEINIKANGSKTVNKSMYNLTVILKRIVGSVFKQYNQSLVTFSNDITQFMIEFQTNYPLSLSYFIYLFKTSQFNATVPASNNVQEITLVQPNSTVSMSIIPISLGLPVSFGLKKYTKKKK